MPAFRVDPSSAVPIFRQVADGIRAAVAAGIYRPGELVPSVRQQALALVVNPNTIQRAYEELERDGLLVSRKGVGMVVAPRATASASRDAAADVRTSLAAAIEAGIAAGLDRDAIDELYAAAWRAMETSKRGRK